MKFAYIGGMTMIVTTKELCPNKNDGLGPYYPPKPMGLPFYKAEPLMNSHLGNNDLTINPVNGLKAKGKEVLLLGNILSTKGIPLENALVELWSTNIFGSYVVEKNPKGKDEGFFGYGKVHSNVNGKFEFLSIVPKAYNRYGFLIKRPPHFHLKITHPKMKPLAIELKVSEAPVEPDSSENKVNLKIPSKGKIYTGNFAIITREVQK